ncbi:hypothetical protein ACYULU_09500 [Breznakiellaceae bacterium SP9]
MTIEQIVEIPASRRLTIDVPPEIPEGKNCIIIQFPATEDLNPGAEQQRRWKEAIEKCRGIAQGSSWTSDRLLEERRKDKEREEAKYRRSFHKDDKTS